jgi:hypothetical protein
MDVCKIGDLGRAMPARTPTQADVGRRYYDDRLPDTPHTSAKVRPVAGVLPENNDTAPRRTENVCPAETSGDLLVKS